MLGPDEGTGQPATSKTEPLASLVSRAFRVGAQFPALAVALLIAVSVPIITLQIQTTDAENAAAVADGIISYRLASFFAEADGVAALEGALGLDPERSLSRATQLLVTHGDVDSVVIADSEGNVVAYASRISDAVAVPADPEAVAWIASTSEVFVGSPQYHPTLGKRAAILAVPIVSPRGERRGMMQMVVDIGWMTDGVTRPNQNSAADTYVINEIGQVIIHEDEWRVLNGQQLENARSGLRVGLDGRLSVIGVVQTEWSGHVIQVVNAAPLSRLLTRGALGLIPLALILSSFAVSRVVKRRLVRDVMAPIHDLEKAVGSYGPDNLGMRAGASSVTEFHNVAMSFNETADRIDSLVVSLTRSNEQLDEFASVAAHDLQEPMRKVRAFGDLLATAPDTELTDEARGYIDRMQNAAARMQQLIDDLLAYSRLTNPATPFQRVDLNEVVTEVLDDLEYVILEAAAEVAVDDLPVVEAGPTQMRQLMQNLLSNSLKFSRSGTPPRIRIAGRSGPNGQTTISIVDNGIGFDPKYDERVFGIFERLHGRGEYPGTGIGLALCRKIVERHGGTITAEGTEGEGATFTFTLPTYTP